MESGRLGAGTKPIRHTTLKTELSSISTRLKTGFLISKLTGLLDLLHAVLLPDDGSVNASGCVLSL
jgi:hypothetical protein